MMKKSFQTRVFVNILLLVLIISISTAFLFARVQTRLLESDMTEDGMNAAKVLAANLRLGLLTGGKEFLEEPIAGIMEQTDVLQVAVYGKEGTLVLMKEKTGLKALRPPGGIIAQLRKNETPVFFSGPDHFEFWVPVLYSRNLGKYAEGFFPKPPVDKTTIGFVRLSMSKSKIVEGRKDILAWLMLIVAICILLGSAVSYFIASRVTNPLKSLVTEIHTMEDEGLKRVSTGGDDEITELAEAFNAMADSIENRESARREAERILHESEERLKTVIDNAPIVLYAVDEEGMFTLSEGKGLEGALKPGEIVGASALDLYGSLMVEEGREMRSGADLFRRVVAGQTVNFISTVSDRCFDNQLVPYKDTAGKIIGAIGVAVDVTERKQTEQKLQAYQDELRSLASELALTEERERRSIATDLHDHIGQLLAISKIKLGALKEMSRSTTIAANVTEIRELIDQAIEYTRSLTFELSSPVLYELGLGPAVEQLAEQIGKKHGLAVTTENCGEAGQLDTEMNILIFKMVRELLLNIVKHAQAEEVTVSICSNDRGLSVIVEDDGIGFICPPPEAVEEGNMKSFGLFSIRERLRYASGHLHISSSPGQGTMVTLDIPIKSGRDGGKNQQDQQMR